jgi:putative ABC transport system ATP-binding protein
MVTGAPNANGAGTTAPDDRDAMVRLEDVRFRFGDGPYDFALHVPDWTVSPGERIAVVGPSGSGKTTLIHLVAGILTPSAGRIRVDGACLTERGETERRAFRITRIGMVFQDFGLLDYLNVLENILLPYRINPALALSTAVREKARSLAAGLGIDRLLRRRIDRISQGERQRVALCRAMLPGPKVLLADEPTGNLDPRTTGELIEVLFACLEETGATLITVTHDQALLERFNRVVDVSAWGGGR